MSKCQNSKPYSSKFGFAFPSRVLLRFVPISIGICYLFFASERLVVTVRFSNDRCNHSSVIVDLTQMIAEVCREIDEKESVSHRIAECIFGIWFVEVFV